MVIFFVSLPEPTQIWMESVVKEEQEIGIR